MYSNIDEAWKVSNDLDKYKNSFKPITSVKNATNELTEINIETTERPVSEKLETVHKDKSSSPSSAIFQTEVQDLKKLIHKDDGKQCQRLFNHYQTCNQCKNNLNNNKNIPNQDHSSAYRSIHKSTPGFPHRSVNGSLNATNNQSNDVSNLSLNSFKLTENFVDFTKYTDLLKNKNNSNIVSIVLFGLLVIIILSMINNE
jgi:hypothetical protein